MNNTKIVLQSLTSLNPMVTDTWEVGMFDVDCAGHHIHPILGVRVNGGTWIPADVLQDAIVQHQVSAIHHSEPS